MGVVQKVRIRFHSGYSRPGGPGWNPGEVAAFDEDEARYIVETVKCGDVVSASPTKAPSVPSVDKMARPAEVKGTAKPKRERLTEAHHAK